MACNLLYILATLTFVFTLAASESCHVVDDLEDVDYMNRFGSGDYVLVGKAGKKIPDKHYPGDSDVYSSQFEVQCVYKKPEDTEVNTLLTINGAGKVPDCVEAEMEPGKSYIVYLNKDMKPKFQPDPAISQVAEEFIFSCNPIEFPKGLADSSKIDCYFGMGKPEPSDCPNAPVETPAPITEDNQPTDNEGGDKPEDKSEEKPQNTDADKGGVKVENPAENTGDGEDVTYASAKAIDGDGNSSKSILASVALLLASVLSIMIL